MRKSILAVGLVGLVGLACLQDGGGAAAPANVSNAVLRGDVGYVRGIERADDVVSRDYGSFTEIELYASRGPSENAMVLVDLNGGLANWGRPGLQRTILHDAYSQDMSVIGCAGQQRDNWDYDEPADETDVRIQATNTPDNYRMFFTSRWFANGRSMPPTQTVNGEFEFTVPGGGASQQPAPSRLQVQTGNISGEVNGVILPARPDSASAVRQGNATTVDLDFTRDATHFAFMLPQDGAQASLVITSQGRPVEVTGLAMEQQAANGLTWNVFTATLAGGAQVRGSFAIQ